VNKGGRPPRQWRWLVHDVDRVIAQRGGGVRKACTFLSNGGFPRGTLPVYSTDPRLEGVHSARVVWGKWEGMKVDTLVRKYRREKAFRK
jgi:hypothetical protein